VTSQTRDYWLNEGDNELQSSLQNFARLKRDYAKNIIVMIGDGMSLGTAVAGRIKSGQDLGDSGEEYMTSLDTMPFVGLAKTYSSKLQMTSSIN